MVECPFISPSTQNWSTDTLISIRREHILHYSLLSPTMRASKTSYIAVLCTSCPYQQIQKWRSIVICIPHPLDIDARLKSPCWYIWLRGCLCSNINLRHVKTPSNRTHVEYPLAEGIASTSEFEGGPSCSCPPEPVHQTSKTKAHVRCSCLCNSQLSRLFISNNWKLWSMLAISMSLLSFSLTATI